MPLPKRLAALLLRDYAVLTPLSWRYPSLWGRYKLVTHPFATETVQEQAPSTSFDLHVLGAPLAFILSYDQTL
jgi:hypothetical protein